MLKNNTYIALLRGINVSGQKIIRMAELKKHFENYGFTDVKTYIQSGNIIFGTVSNPKDSETKIHKLIEKEYGYDVKVFVVTHNILKECLSKNPFLKLDVNVKGIAFTFLSKIPSVENIRKFSDLQLNTEQYEIAGNIMFLYFPDGFGRAKLNGKLIEQKLNVQATARNLNTIKKLIELSKS